MSELRIPFEEAIGEPKLLKNRFESLSVPQQVALKIAYGLPLGETQDDEGFSELDYWAAFQGFARYDELGILQEAFPDRCPYEPQEFSEAWAVIGRRGSKSDAFAATVSVYEGALGGHEAHVRKGQPAICFQIAQDLRMARYSLHFITAALESSPLLRKMVRSVTADRVDLSNNVTIACVPPTLKSVRGYAAAVGVLDEVGVWYQESDSANPDYEIYRALSPAQIQFPNRKLIGISTPWNKQGLLYKFYSAGTRGSKLPSAAARREYEGVLVLHGPTGLMQNPIVTRTYLEREAARDAKAFERECLAQFQDSISGFLPSELVAAATVPGLKFLGPLPRPLYVAAIDPAFRRDAFAFLILHLDEANRIIVDRIERWEGGHSQTPREILGVIASICRTYGIGVLYSDQYQFEALSNIAQEFGLSILQVPFSASSKAELYGNLQQLFYQRRIQLLDNEELLKELRQLERTVTEGGVVQIAAPRGCHDDLATVLAIAAQQAINLQPKAEVAPQRDPTPQERVEAQIAARSRGVLLTPWD